MTTELRKMDLLNFLQFCKDKDIFVTPKVEQLVDEYINLGMEEDEIPWDTDMTIEEDNTESEIEFD